MLTAAVSQESSCILVPGQRVFHIIICGPNCCGEKCLENFCCLRCKRELEPGAKSVAVYMFAQTVGVRPRQKSSAQRMSFCPQCSVSLAMGLPPEGALNLAAWDMIRDLVSADPALNDAAWENLRGHMNLLPATGTDGARSSSDSWVTFRR